MCRSELVNPQALFYDTNKVYGQIRLKYLNYVTTNLQLISLVLNKPLLWTQKYESILMTQIYFCEEECVLNKTKQPSHPHFVV